MAAIAVIATMLLRLSRRQITVAPTLLLTLVPTCRTMVAIVIAVVVPIPTNVSMLRRFTLMIVAIVVFCERGSAD
jgi:hypothetical protein